MEANVEYIVFEGKGFPVDESLLENITEEHRILVREMMQSGFLTDKGIDVSRFLREDKTINLELLELAVTLTVLAKEANSTDDDITLNLWALDIYYEFRGISGNEDKKREERTFLLGFVSATASEASSRDTLVVKYVV